MFDAENKPEPVTTDTAEISEQVTPESTVESLTPQDVLQPTQVQPRAPRGPRGGLTATERKQKQRAREKLEKLQKEARKAEREKTEAARAVARQEKEFIKLSKSNWDRWDYPGEADEADARNAYREDGIKDPNVCNQLWEEIPETCRDLGISANYFVHRYGIAAYQRHRAGYLVPPEPHVGWGGRSETLYVQEQFRLYDAMMTGRTLFGETISFEQWLDYRDRERKDLFWHSKEVLDIPLVEEVHRPITSLYPEINADGLLFEGYSLHDVHKSIQKVFEGQKLLLILDPRTWMKTAVHCSYVLMFLLTWPDARAFILSGTDPLAKGFLRILKSHISRIKGAVPRKFNLLFPEYSLRGIDISSEEPILLPCRRWPQRDWSVFTSGWSSASSGPHSDYWGGDDIVQEEGTPQTREKQKNKVANLGNVLENGPQIFLGTRYDEEDLYQTYLDLLKEDPNALRHSVRAVWKTGDGRMPIPVEKVTWEDVVSGNIVLGWPDKEGSPEKTFQYIHKAILLNRKDALHQLFNSPVTDDENEPLRFSEDLLDSNVQHISLFPAEGDRVLIVDVAYSDGSRADYTAVTSIQYGLNPENRSSIFVHDVYLGRKRLSESAMKVAELNYSFRPRIVMIESIQAYDLYLEKIYAICQSHGWPKPEFYKILIDRAPKAKLRRIRPLEILLREKRLIFAPGDYRELVKEQFLRFNGLSSTGGKRKDDALDCLAFAAKFMPADVGEPDPEPSQELLKHLEDQRLRTGMYDLIFGSGGTNHVSTTSEWIRAARGESDGVAPTVEAEDLSRGVYGIPGLRGFGKPKN